jgi:hypothetical protein
MNDENETEWAETAAHKVQTPGKHQKERIDHAVDAWRL